MGDGPSFINILLFFLYIAYVFCSIIWTYAFFFTQVGTYAASARLQRGFSGTSVCLGSARHQRGKYFLGGDICSHVGISQHPKKTFSKKKSFFKKNFFFFPKNVFFKNFFFKFVFFNKCFFQKFFFSNLFFSKNFFS